VVGGMRSPEVRNLWRCAVVGGARCEWGFVRGGVLLVALVVLGGCCGPWWSMVVQLVVLGGRWWFVVVVSGSVIGVVVLYIFCRYKFHR